MASKIGVGDKVQDRVTNFTGVVTARAEFLTGPPRVLVEASATENGSNVKSDWFDESRFDVIQAGFVQVGTAQLSASNPE